LGTADSFAVLAGSGITNTGSTTITGDLGSFPTASETGLNTVTLHGVDHGGDAVTQGAKQSLVTAYDDAAGRGPATSEPVELGGQTLLPGVYGNGTFGLTGTLTLNAQGDPNAEFVFQTASTLVTATDSRVMLINSAVACNVVWQIGSSATFGTGTQFIGDVLAHTSISAKSGAGFEGRLLARTGAVTLIHNTISRPSCAAPLPTPSASPSPSSHPTSTAQPTSSGQPTSTAKSTSGGAPAPSPTADRSRTGAHGRIPAGIDSDRSPGAGAPTLPVTGLPTPEVVSVAVVLLGLGGTAMMASRRKRSKPGAHRA
jgi:type VI secretion system secreted protein VgrG